MSKRVFYTIIILSFIMVFSIELFFAGYASENNEYDHYDAEEDIDYIKDLISKRSKSER